MINKNNASCAKIAARSDERKELTGVLVTPERTIATDSLKMIVVDTVGEREEFEPFIADGKSIGALGAICEKNGASVNENRNFLREIEGEYPDVQRVIPESKNATRKIVLNPKYVKEIMSVMEKINKEVVMEIYESEVSPIVFRIEEPGRQGAIGLVMPIRK